MPIYEYYCPKCDARYRALLRSFDAEAPACPRCGNEETRKMVSSFRVARSQVERDIELQERMGSVNQDDPDAVTAFMKENMEQIADSDNAGFLGSDAFREVLHRRSQGASEEEMADIEREWPEGPEGELPPGVRPDEKDIMSHLETHEEHEHDHEHGHGHGPKKRKPRDLGWA